MSFNLNYWLKETINIDNVGGISIYQKVRPRIVCQDGYSVSVQASEYAYCEPRFTQFQNEDGWHVINGAYYASSDLPRIFRTNSYTPYEAVELGYPSEPDELINDFAEIGYDDTPNYTNTVYGYVPVDIVEKLIEKHGGFKVVDKSNVKGGTK